MGQAIVSLWYWDLDLLRSYFVVDGWICLEIFLSLFDAEILMMLGSEWCWTLMMMLGSSMVEWC
jgi:hypothetical protein